jgi:hypothetical protein
MECAQENGLLNLVKPTSELQLDALYRLIAEANGLESK